MRPVTDLPTVSAADDELALLAAARRGEVEAFNGLVLRYQSRAYNLAYRLLGDSASAADATQEAFIHAYQRLSEFRTGYFRAWLLKIVTNACYDELRRQRRRPQVSIEALSTDSPDYALPQLVSDPADTPEQIAVRRDLDQIIQACLNQLENSFRTVAILIDIQGYDYQEVATIIGANLGTVKSRLSRARAKLRDCLQGAGELLPRAFRQN
jgi:RNA polymerase sigma factor (sigma-70 family)